MIEVKIDDIEIVKVLQNLQAATGDLSPAFKDIREVLIRSTKGRFATGIGPDGQKWEGNSDATIERKGRNKPLVDGGTLADQIIGELIGLNALEIYSTMDYAAMQQFGGTKAEFPHLWGDIPSRPFLGISDQDQIDILAIIDHHLSDALK